MNNDPIQNRAIRLLQELAKSSDPEHAHYEADKVLCELLRELGFHLVVDAYDEIRPKWYA